VEWYSSPNKEWREDCSSVLNLTRFSLDLMGLWPCEDRSPISIFFRQHRVTFVAALLILVYTLPQSYAIYLVRSDPNLVINGVSMAPTMVISVFTFFTLSRHKKGILEMIQIMVNDWLTEKTSWERKVMRKQAARARILLIIGFMLLLECGVNFTLLPFLGIAPRILNNITDPGMDRGRFLPTQVAFPFDVISSPRFEVMYILTCLAGSADAMGDLLPVMLFATAVFHASGQYEILGTKMLHLFDDVGGDGGKDKSNFQARLKLVVNDQTRLHRLMSLTNDMIEMILLAQILGLAVSTILLGFDGIQMMFTDDGSMTLGGILGSGEAVVMEMYLILVYCIANEVYIHHSQRCADYIYSSAWYTVTASYSKDVTKIMAFSQSAVEISVGGFNGLSLNTFLQ
ncbi:hypothetical protein QAD02_000081, partial [Eretmocerus hayati]